LNVKEVESQGETERRNIQDHATTSDYSDADVERQSKYSSKEQRIAIKTSPIDLHILFLILFSYYKGLPLADLQATEPYYQNHHYDVMNRLISTCDLISWSFQIARGMNYLVSKNVCALWGVILTVIKISGLKWRGEPH
jgi:hypothetical protein